MNIKNKTVVGYGISIIAFFLLWLIAYFTLPNKMPVGTVLDGAIIGALTGMTAMGLVLIYKSARIINFAQAELGGVASTAAVVLVLGSHLNYYEAVLIGIASAVIMGVLIDKVIIWRFQKAPRLILTVATIGLAQLFEAAEYKIPNLYGNGNLSGTFTVPINFKKSIGGYVFTGNHLIAVIVIPIIMIGIWWFLAKTDIGIGIRASSDSSDRALLLGIPVRRLSLITWVVASVLSAVGAILYQPIQGVQLGTPLGPEFLLTPLAAAAIARFEKLPLALYASIFIGIFEEGIYWSYSQSSWIYIGLFVIIAIALFSQRQNVVRVAGNELGSFVNIKEIRPLARAIKKLPAVRAATWIVTIIAIGVLLAIPHLGGTISNASNLIFFTNIAIYGMIAVSLVILTGWAGQISLGQYAFTGAGAATMGLFLSSFHFPILPAMLMATIVGSLLAIIIGIPALRTTGLNLAVMTLAFAVMLNTGIIDSSNFSALTPTQFPTMTLLGRFDMTSQSTLYYLTILMLGIVIYLTRNLQKTRSGRIIRAVRDNYKAAASYGASPLQVRLVAFGFAGAIAGLAGSLLALSLGQIPSGGFDPAQNLSVFTMVIFGGMGSILGGFLGAIFVEAILFFWKTSSALESLGTGLGLLIILYVYPAGIGGLVYKIRDLFVNRIAPKDSMELDRVDENEQGASTVIPGPAHDAVVRLNALEELELKTKTSQPTAGQNTPAAQDFSDSILAAINVDSGYDKAKILFDVSFGVKDSEILALLGTNGAGKSTILRVFAGLLPAYKGKVIYNGEDITNLDPISRVKKGIVMVPGGRGVFTTLTVKENLYLASWIHKKDKQFVKETMARIFTLFPILQTRKDTLAGLLSGGEQQMLTIAQALLCRAKVILIDELSLGLAPTVVAELLKAVEALSASGVTVIVVEQSVNVATAIASRAVFMERGQVRFSGPTPSVEQQPNLLRSVFLRAATKAHSRPDDPAFSKRIIDTKSTSAFGVLNVSKRFGTVNVLNDVSLSVSKGEILGIIGANGAGKTTLFDVCSGFLSPNSGKIILDGSDVTHLSPHQRARRGLGRVFQDAQLFPSMTVAEVLSVALERHVEVKDPIASMLGLEAVVESEEKLADKVDELLEEMGLNKYRSSFVTELSTGTRRVLDLACSMAHRPRVLLLDEPSAGIAQRESEAMGELILGLSAETGASFIIIEHDVPLVSYVSDRLICLHLGEIIAEGPTTDVLADQNVISAYLGRDDVTINRSRPTVPA